MSGTPLAEAIRGTFATLGATPSRMYVTGSFDATFRKVRYGAAALLQQLEAGDVERVTVYSAPESRATISVYVRDRHNAGERDHRHIYIVTDSTEAAVTPWPGIEALSSQYDVAHGGSLRAASFEDAIAEVSLVTVSTYMSQERCDRIRGDSTHGDTRKQLRRLYPVTIIGPDIWARLPPLPAVDPMPTVSDLGDCKVLTAWPTLVDCHDPQFLLGTRELRRWLWPHTIQNPADDPDEIDRKLRWMDLLPW